MGLAESERRPLICRRCRVPVNVLFCVDGGVEYVHAQAWNDYDHDPVPVPAAHGDGNLVCDFCGAPKPRWEHRTSEPVEATVGSQVHGLGTAWAACNACDAVIRARDLERLLDRYFTSPCRRDAVREATIADAQFAAEIAAAERESCRNLFVRLLGDLCARGLIPAPPAPPVRLLPVKLPRVRQRLVSLWGSDFAREVICGTPEPVLLPGVDCGVGDLAVPVVHPPSEHVNGFSARMRFGTAAAELYWASREFTTLALLAAKKLPDLSVTRDDLPADHGLLVFAEPIAEISKRGDVSRCPAVVVAATWTLVPGGVWLTLYAQPEQLFPTQDREVLRERIGFLLPVAPGAGIAFGQALPPSAATEVAGGAWGTLLAAWFLMRQPRVSTQTTQAPDKQFARAYARANNGRAPSPVRIVDLRRHSSAKRDPGSGGTAGRVLTCQSLVGASTGGFWRDQWYGPQSSLRKRVFIAPYVRGPAGAPFAGQDDDRTTVTVL